MKLIESIRKYCAVPAVTGCLTVAAAFPAFAEAEASSSNVTAADWSSVIEALTAQVSVSTVVAALATFVAAGIGLVFMWWGLRKGIRSLMAAFRKGRMSI